MKKLFLTIGILLAGAYALNLNAQEVSGIENADYWLPRKEIGVRYTFSSIRAGHEITLGYRIDDNWTAGLSLSDPKYRADGVVTKKGFGASLYGRRYFHLGSADKWAIYCDAYLGADFLKASEGLDPSSSSAGSSTARSVLFTAKLEPGIRYRFFNNHQIFLGPSIGTNCIGFHLGLAI
ncbi:MAG: hypothetical protein ACI3ZF_06950 [Candidatus Cryptobacteroides sp.]